MKAGDYRLIRSGRKTLALEVTEGGEVLVRAPYQASQRDIDRFVASHADWLERTKTRQRQRQENRPKITPDMREELTRKALDILPGRVAHYAAIMGVAPAGITITGAEKRFGSCSANNRICFSWRLMAYPPEAIEYVVVHELAHIRHHDHGPDFYAFVASVLPDYKEREKLLRG